MGHIDYVCQASYTSRGQDEFVTQPTCDQYSYEYSVRAKSFNTESADSLKQGGTHNVVLVVVVARVVVTAEIA